MKADTVVKFLEQQKGELDAADLWHLRDLIELDGLQFVPGDAESDDNPISGELIADALTNEHRTSADAACAAADLAMSIGQEFQKYRSKKRK